MGCPDHKMLGPALKQLKCLMCQAGCRAWMQGWVQG